MSEIKASVEYIDVERAHLLLGEMAPNRNVRALKVERYAADMAAGRWRLTGEAIKITADGVVIDGEHRLRAVIKSGTSIQSLVVYGVALDDRVAMDTGAPRRLSDHLKFLGETNCNELAAAVYVLYCRHRGHYLLSGYLEPSHQQLLAELEKHPGIRDSLSAVMRVCQLLRMSKGVCAALHYDMSTIDSSDADDFWERLYSGECLTNRDSIMVLRKRMEESAMTRGPKLDRVYVQAFIIKAWNAYREGREIAILRWARGGANPESFPELV